MTDAIQYPMRARCVRAIGHLKEGREYELICENQGIVLVNGFGAYWEDRFKPVIRVKMGRKVMR
jgi:hypothetical protein